MNNWLLRGLIAATVGATVALASPVLARGGFGGGGGHGGAIGGGHFGGMGAAHFSGMGASHFGGMGGPHFSGMGMVRSGGANFGGPHLGGVRLATAPMAHAAFAPRFAGTGFHGMHGFHHHAFFFHHHRHFRSFAFIGAPYYAGYYDGCWRRTLTPYGWQWVNVCGDDWY